LLFIFTEVEIVFLMLEILLINAEKVLAQPAQDCIFALPKQKVNFVVILAGIPYISAQDYLEGSCLGANRFAIEI